MPDPDMARVDLREALRVAMLDVWRRRSRDTIEATDEQHVDDLLIRAVMPVLDDCELINWSA